MKASFRQQYLVAYVTVAFDTIKHYSGCYRKTENAMPVFDLDQFLPYLLNQAAEATSAAFQVHYRAEYGMTRTQWRVMANLGKHGSMTAVEICRITYIDKTKVSRAVLALEAAGMLARGVVAGDRRQESLTLTKAGQDAFSVLGQRALAFDRALHDRLGTEQATALANALRSLVGGAVP
jgi:DNA-binding MarR family transcriptional regulator